MVPLEEQMGREQGTDKIEGGAFSGVNEFNIIEYSAQCSHCQLEVA